jgi:hypothetical protein
MNRVTNLYRDLHLLCIPAEFSESLQVNAEIGHDSFLPYSLYFMIYFSIKRW